MRVGFTGAQGTGKTTLLKAVDEAGLGFKAVPSTAREAVKAGFKVNRDADMLSQLVTTVSRVSMEDHWYNEMGKTISDRTPLDSLAYTFYQAKFVWPEKPNEYYLTISTELVVNHMKKYDHIFYFPPYFNPKPDGVRDGDVAYQQAIDHEIKTALLMLDVTYHTVPMGPTPHRLEFLTKLIN